MYVCDLTKREYRSKPHPSITGPADVFHLVKRRLAARTQEHFLILLLNARHAVLGIETISVGTLNASIVHPREVFRAAVLGNAASLILCHNHPSGDPTPSDDDVAITRRLVQVGELHGIPILDHVVVTKKTYASFGELRLL